MTPPKPQRRPTRALLPPLDPQRFVPTRERPVRAKARQLQSDTEITPHSHAWAQVRGWVRDHRPGATYVPTLSTASAAAGLAEGPQAYQAAVCAPVAAERQGYPALRDLVDARVDNNGAAQFAFDLDAFIAAIERLAP